MAVAFPILVPLIIHVARASHPATALFWSLLGLLAAFEASFMWAYIFPGGLLFILMQGFVALAIAGLVVAVGDSIRKRRIQPPEKVADRSLR